MIRIILAEDMDIVRGALAALLGLEVDMSVVAQVGTGDAIVPTALQHRPDVAVLDVDLPGLDGLTAAGQLKEQLPGCAVLMLTGYGKAGGLRRALEAGVSGYLLKTTSPADLAEAIRTVHAGGRVLDPKLAVTAWEAPGNPLTPREVEVLRIAAEGADADEIGARLHLSARTVRNYLSAMATKLDARNRVDAVRIAQESGWI
ncbi:DNA-binding response regulator [Streptosporangium sp. NPDC000396]|uniref:response regulator transcription factor n=1 Tax=Streptosporangium sp. NPDC000396 TaxID=3366185 RepID=UPI003689D4E5